MRRSTAFYLDALRIAIQSIFAHKLRAFLTLIGVIIGVASVVVVGASISGLNSYVVDQVSRLLGSNHFMIARVASSGRMTEEQWQKMDKRNKRLERKDMDWIERLCINCEEVGAQMDARQDLQHEGLDLFGTQVSGVTASMGQIEDKTMAEGRFLLPHEVDHAMAVCVIGMDVRNKFFEGRDPIGQTLKLRGNPLRIVGVEAARGSMFGQTFDNTLYLPISTFGRIYGRRQSVRLHGLAKGADTFQPAIDDARVALRSRHRLKPGEEDDFGLINVQEVNAGVDEFTGNIAMVVTPITLISLIVGGIVVMNIMLVSVTERTFEIGLRKAIGAKRREILVQFLIESALLCGLGGVLGLLFASAITTLVTATTPIPMRITIGYIALSLFVSTTIGILAGIYPAMRASRLDPVVALNKVN
ncbi:MAG: ABC transporter permease [Vicinamibacteria bacterium]|nr:ABC transporter permease [Vicinamibacteria bacterium]